MGRTSRGPHSGRHSIGAFKDRQPASLLGCRQTECAPGGGKYHIIARRRCLCGQLHAHQQSSRVGMDACLPPYDGQARRERDTIAHARQEVIVNVQVYAAKSGKADFTCVISPLGRLGMFSIVLVMGTEAPQGQYVPQWTQRLENVNLPACRGLQDRLNKAHSDLQDQGLMEEKVSMKKGPEKLQASKQRSKDEEPARQPKEQSGDSGDDKAPAPKKDETAKPVEERWRKDRRARKGQAGGDDVEHYTRQGEEQEVDSFLTTLRLSAEQRNILGVLMWRDFEVLCADDMPDCTIVQLAEVSRELSPQAAAERTETWSRPGPRAQCDTYWLWGQSSARNHVHSTGR
eukprot:4338806-Amphidinium_carterae.1